MTSDTIPHRPPLPSSFQEAPRLPAEPGGEQRHFSITGHRAPIPREMNSRRASGDSRV